jgi:hypothetical protein
VLSRALQGALDRLIRRLAQREHPSTRRFDRSQE